MSLSFSPDSPSIASDISADRTVARLSAAAFIAGLSINIVSIFIGNPYTIMAIIAALSLIMTLAWSEYELPWMLFVSVLAANPVNLQMTIPSTLIFALWLIFLRIDYLRALPKWIFIPNLIALGGVLTSSVTWLFSPSHLDPLNQAASVINYVLGPFLLMPVIYFRAQKENLINGSILLVFFVLPSIIVILLAYIFGHPLAVGIGTSDLQTNLFTYVLGKTEFQFIRTHIGFLLASFICASVAVILSESGIWSRILAGLAAGVCFFLLMVTGSIASAMACIGGLVVMLAMAARFVPAGRVVLFVLVMAGLFAAVWALSPKIVKDYVAMHYEQRFGGNEVNNADRTERWGPSARYILRNPAGIGWSLYVEEIKVYPHNDYLSYGIAYGIIGGAVYLGMLCALLWIFLTSGRNLATPAQLTLLLAGIGVLVVVMLNSITDHMTANRWYFNVAWSIIWLAYFVTRPMEGEARGE